MPFDATLIALGASRYADYFKLTSDYGKDATAAELERSMRAMGMILDTSPPAPPKPRRTKCNGCGSVEFSYRGPIQVCRYCRSEA